VSFKTKTKFKNAPTCVKKSKKKEGKIWKDPQLEHLCLEIPGHNRCSKLLLRTIYYSEWTLGYNTWIEKFENFLAYITTNGMVLY